MAGAVKVADGEPKPDRLVGTRVENASYAFHTKRLPLEAAHCPAAFR